MTIKSKVKFQPTYLELARRCNKGVISVSAALWDMHSTGPRIHEAACDLLEDAGIFIFANTGRFANLDVNSKNKPVDPYTFDDGQPDLKWLDLLLGFCQSYDAAIEVDKATMASFAHQMQYINDNVEFKPTDKFCIRAVNTYIEYLYITCLKKGVRFSVLPYDSSIYEQNSLESVLSTEERISIDSETLVVIPGSHLWVPACND